MDSAFGVLLEATLLHVILGGLFALVLVLWAFDKFLDARDQRGWRKAREDGKIPLKPEYARRGGSTGKMHPIASVLEAAAENQKKFNFLDKDYEDAPLEVFARQARWVLDLLHPDLRLEWLSTHMPEELTDAAEFLEGLGLEDSAEKLRDLLPYQQAVHAYQERDMSVPDDAPEAVNYAAISHWLEEHKVWHRTGAKAEELLERDYPWKEV